MNQRGWYTFSNVHSSLTRVKIFTVINELVLQTLNIFLSNCTGEHKRDEHDRVWAFHKKLTTVNTTALKLTDHCNNSGKSLVVNISF